MRTSVARSVAALAVAGFCVASAAAQTGPAGLVFFGYNVVKESMNSSAPIVQIAGGQHHAIALRADGTVVTWGVDQFGQCDVPYGITNAVQVVAGDNYSVVVRADGSVAAFGVDTYGQRDIPSNLGPVKLVAAGGDLTLVELQNGTVWAFGQGLPNEKQTIPSFNGAVQLAVDENGQALALDVNGNVTGFGTTVPSNLGPCSQIAAGGSNFGAIQVGGTMQLWGAGWMGTVPPPTNLTNVVQLSLSNTNGVAIQQGGAVTVWGVDLQGTISKAPQNLQQVCACYQSILGIRSDNSVVGWGDQTGGKVTIPQHLYGVIGMSAGYEHAAFLNNNGTLNAWGDNTHGQCNFPAGSGFAMVTAGLNHTVAYGSSQPLTFSMFGDNLFMQTTLPSGLPVLDKIWAAGNSTYGHVKGGGLKGWGLNGSGELSLATSLADASFVTGGYADCYAIGLDNNVYAAGANDFGELMVPTGIGTITQVSGMNQHVIALDSTGAIHTWGSNSYHQMDQIPAGALTNVQQVGAGYEHSVVLKTDGTVLAWGGAESQQIAVPSGLSGISQIAVGGYFNVCLPKMTMGIVPYNVVQGQAGMGTVYLAQPAPANGTFVQLQSNNPSVIINMGANGVMVPQGAYQAQFPVQVGNVPSTAQVLITATLGNCSQTSMITIAPPAFTIGTNVGSVVGGSTDVLFGSVTLSSPAPAGGATVQILSSDPSLTPQQSSVFIAAGKTTSPNFAISSSVVTAAKTVTISGKYANQTLSCKVQVLPFQVTSFAFSPSSVLGGWNASATLTLNDTPVNPVNVSFVSNFPAYLPSPGTIAIATASKVLSFPTVTQALDASVVVTATLNGASMSATVLVQKPIQFVQFSSAPWYGGCATTCIVYISSPAPMGGVTVNLQEGLNCVPEKPTVTIPAGATQSAPFLVDAFDETSTQVGEILTSVNGQFVTGYGVITPNTIASLQILPASTLSVSHNPGNGQMVVTLLGAPVHDTTVNVASSLPDYASFLSQTLTILAGQASASATFKHIGVVTRGGSLTLSATRIGVTKQALLTLLP